ncbi:MAG: AAA family ATPase [Candidatus Magnetomorum sp.]|nr:AAA family ATPase [Candidatus Magnetomorum sp.]
MPPKRIKLPYGISNFERLVRDGYYYVDKTKYIQQIEDSDEPYIFFLRPRRFGKSLFVSQLRYYYGLEHKDNFEKIFGNYYIGKHPTPRANKYYVLHFEFSRIDTASPESTFQGFLDNVKVGIKEFIEQYDQISSPEKKEILSETRPNTMLMNLLSAYRKCNIYIIIDEYDHFANEILAFNFKGFKSFVGENGFVRKFYETIKAATGDGSVDLFFGTGVTPITLDSMTSGFNIAKNFSTKKSLNEMQGFTEKEVETLIHLTLPDTSNAKILEDMRAMYNGYRFNENCQKIYNPDMVLFFLSEYQDNEGPPKELIDTNIASDYGKIKNLFALQKPFQNSQVLDELMEFNQTSALLTQQFSFERDFNRDDFVSLLFYLGLISIKSAFLNRLNFSIPNYVIQELYREFFLDFVKCQNKLDFDTVSVSHALIALAENNAILPFLAIIENALKTLSNQDYKKFDEKHIKALFVGFASLSKLYFIKSEPEIENKYPDIMFLYRPPFFPKYQFLFELKYLSKAGEKALKTKTDEAVAQVNQYLQCEEIQRLKNLKAYVLIFVGSEIKIVKECSSNKASQLNNSPLVGVPKL